MDRRKFLRESSLGLLVMCGILVAHMVLHEVAHLVINFALTGQTVSCGLGPFTIAGGRPATCVAPGGAPAVNALLTPLTFSLVGVAFMFYSARFSSPGVRWGTLTGGIYMWLLEALYSMGHYTPPTLTESGVQYSGDGIRAIEAFGSVAMVPGGVLLFAGLVVAWMRLEYERR